MSSYEAYPDKLICKRNLHYQSVFVAFDFKNDSVIPNYLTGAKLSLDFIKVLPCFLRSLSGYFSQYSRKVLFAITLISSKNRNYLYKFQIRELVARSIDIQEKITGQTHLAQQQQFAVLGYLAIDQERPSMDCDLEQQSRHTCLL